MAYGYRTSPAVQTRVSSRTLLGTVLTIVGIGLAVTAATAYFTQTLPGGLALLAFIAGFVVLIAINATRANEALSLTLFYLFSGLEGIGLGPTIGYYVRAFGPGIVYEAALTTALGMFGLAALVYLTGLDLRRFSGWVYGALIVLVLAGIVSVFTHWFHPAIYAWATLVIFSFLVLIDFARIRANETWATPVQLAVQIYLDAINIFLAVLQLFGMRRRD